MASTYYNEIEPHPCAVLRERIKDGRLPKGWVDERSIEHVDPEELDGYTHCHFFAGIGGFPLAMQLAGWPDDLELWTGGFPCQDISAAGRGAGLSGARSGLWFEWFRLIACRRPARVLIENVPLLRTRGADDVLGAMEGQGYACVPIVVGAEHVGAPHKRHRAWVVCELADADTVCGSAVWQLCKGQPNAERGGKAGALADAGSLVRGEGRHDADGGAAERGEAIRVYQRHGASGSLADRPRQSGEQRPEWDGTGECGGEGELADAISLDGERRSDAPQRQAVERTAAQGGGGGGRLEHSHIQQLRQQRQRTGRERPEAEVGGGAGEGCGLAHTQQQGLEGQRAVAGKSQIAQPWRDGPSRQGWRASDLLPAPVAPRLIDADGNTLPSPQHPWEEPRLTQLPLGGTVDGVSVRLVRAANKHALKGYGNAIVPEVAAAVMVAWLWSMS